MELLFWLRVTTYFVIYSDERDIFITYIASFIGFNGEKGFSIKQSPDAHFIDDIVSNSKSESNRGKVLYR